jgi:hypothetical protein
MNITEEIIVIDKEIKKLEEREAELYAWLRNNIDSHNFDDVRREWNNIRFKIESQHDKKRQKLSNTKIPEINYNCPV